MNKSVPKGSSTAPRLTKVWNDTRGSLSQDRRRVPESARAPQAIDGDHFHWDASLIDHEYEGDWDWKLRPKEAKDILDLLAKMCQLTWGEIKSQKTNSKRGTRQLHHSQAVESIATDAKRRLEQLGRGDQEEMFRFRHGNLARIWGVLEGPTFYILWFDRAHKVCPAE